MTLRTCKNHLCKKPFPPVTPWQKYCNQKCRDHGHWLIRKALLKKGRAKEDTR